MRMWILVLPLATLLTAACADTAETEAESEQGSVLLIERMTRDRKPAPATPSTLHLDVSTEPVVPVKRIPLSKVHVEVGSKQMAEGQGDALLRFTNKSETLENEDTLGLFPPNDSNASDTDAVVPPTAPPAPPTKQLQAAPVVRLNQSPRSSSAATGTSERTVHPQPSFTNVPDIEFDPIHGEHILKLPNTDDDGFVGVRRSRQNVGGQQPPKNGQNFHQNQSANQQPRQQQRVMPKFFRRGRQ